MTTPELLSLIRIHLSARVVARHTVLGSWDSWATDFLARIDALAQAAAKTAVNAATAPAAAAQARMQDQARQFQAYAQEAYSAGMGTVGDSLVQLGTRAGQAAAALGSGLGDAFAAFWGVEPSTAIGAGLLVGLLIAAGAGWLLLTPGGQAVLFGGGKALAKGALL